MLMAVTKLVGNVKIEGTFEGMGLTIERGNIADADEVARGTFAEERAATTFHATTIRINGTLEVAAGASVFARDIQAGHVKVNGDLRSKTLKADSLTVSAGATIGCELKGSPYAFIHREATRRGDILEATEEIQLKAIAILAAAEQNPAALEKVDFDWLEHAHRFTGWECAARSSSGNGCNYTLATPDGKSLHYHYVPLRVEINGFHVSMKNALRYLTVIEGYEY